MGAPKQKWTSEEEDALKAGVVKHGAGKWRTILKDPEFSGILCLRSNVDLKDKWRNMSVIASGWGSHDRSKVAMKRRVYETRRESTSMVLGSNLDDFDGEIVDAMPLAVSSGQLQITGPSASTRSIPRMENLILEAITNLKEPAGSDKDTIAMYIEDQYWLPPNFKHILSMNLKMLMAAGKLIKVKGAYRIAPSSRFSDHRHSRMISVNERQKEHYKAERADIKRIIKPQVDDELAKIRIMTAEEAAAAAARAVAEAELAMAEAEEAAREAEAAEAEAEEAQAFAEAAMMTLKNRSSGNLMA